MTGGLEEYLQRRRVIEAAASAAAAVPLAEGRSAAAQDRDVQKAMARLERQIDRLRSREVALHDELAAHATDFETVTRLHEELREVESERAALEEEWLSLAV